jgi:hypothetical protein
MKKQTKENSDFLAGIELGRREGKSSAIKEVLEDIKQKRESYRDTYDLDEIDTIIINELIQALNKQEKK